MAKTVNFLMGVHNHQPTGNFDHVYREALNRAYHPFFEMLDSFPELKITVHMTGCLLDWLKANEPTLLKLLKKMVIRGQVEMMTGGYYEPILAVIPDHDKAGQIQKLTLFLKDELGAQAVGLWLAERVWEPHLPMVLNQLGVEYTVLDDSHFKSSGLPVEKLDGYYITEEQGYPLAVFPISEKLRYMIPFKEPEQSLSYFGEMATEKGDRAAILADDGEKFGSWPETYHSVYEEKWLERFFQALRKESSWVKMRTFSEYLRAYPARGRIYIPTASYTEMMEWVLMPESHEVYDQAKKILRQTGSTQYDGYLKGGFWRNYFTKYEEANHLHKKMLWVSRRLAEAKEGQNSRNKEVLQQAQNELYQGQCNCPYWHGVFGGLYLNHLRFAVYHHLILAEQLWQQAVNGKEKFCKAEVMDMDLNGFNEVILRNNLVSCYFDPAYGGSLWEWDYKPKGVNLTDALSRHQESYHAKLKNFVKQQHDPHPQGQAASIHDLVRVKEQGLENLLQYDWYLRQCFLDHFLGQAATLSGCKACQYPEEGDFVNQPYEFRVHEEMEGIHLVLSRQGGIWRGGKHYPCSVEKDILLPGQEAGLTANYTLKNTGSEDLICRFGVEFNFNLLAGRADDRIFYIPGRTLKESYLNITSEELEVREAGLKDGWLGVDISLAMDKPAALWRFPIETVSQSEAGFERVYQSTVLLPHWEIKLKPGETWKAVFKLGIKEINKV